MKLQLFFAKFAKVTVFIAPLLLLEMAHAAETDCFGKNRDGGVPGRAICLPPIPILGNRDPAYVDEDMWSYIMCDRYPPNLGFLRMWCAAAGGAIHLDGSCITPPFFDVFAVGKRFSELHFSPCAIDTKYDSGWGASVSWPGCFSGGPQTRYGVLAYDFRELSFHGTNGKNCDLKWEETVYAAKQREIGCPEGTYARPTGNDSMECWYLPASSCDNVGGCNKGTRSDSFDRFPRLPYSVDGRAHPSSNLIGNPINTALLNKVQREEDLAMLPGGLQFVRHYNSTPLPPVLPETGKGTWDYWRHTYMRRIVVPPNTTGVLGVAWRETGQMDYYDTGGKPIANLNGAASTLQKTAQGWTLTQSNGDREFYDSDGKLLRLASINDITQKLIYSDTSTLTSVAPQPGLLISINDDFGRSIHLTYDAASRLATMTDPAGNVFQYRYDDKNEDDKAGNLAQVIYPDQAVRNYLYENAKYKRFLTGIANGNNVRLSTYSYDNNGVAISTERAGGIEHYDVSSWNFTTHRVTTVINALGGEVTKYYYPQGGAYRPTSITRRICPSCKASTDYLYYDDMGNLIRTWDVGNNLTQYYYDLTRNLETRRIEGLRYYGGVLTTPATRTISTDWHPTLRLPIQIAEPQKLTTISYDAVGRVLIRTEQATTDANGSQGFGATLVGSRRIWANTYDSHGQLTRAASPGGAFTTYTYYPKTATCTGGHLGCRGQLQSLTDNQGLTTSFDAYDALGRLLQSTDGNGLITRNTFDWKGRLLTRVVTAGPYSQTTRYIYNSGGRLAHTENPDGSALDYTYDTAGRLIRITDNTGNAVEYTLDAMGNRIAEAVYDPQDNLRRQARQAFDSLSTLKQHLDAGSNATDYDHDAAGNVISETDPLNHQTQYQYDSLYRISQTTDALNGITRYGYNGQGRLNEVTDPRGLKTSYAYSGFGEMLEQTSPDTGKTAYTYTADGKLESKTDAKGNVTRYTYDAIGRLTQTQAGTQLIQYTYDPGSARLTKITDPASETRYGYDLLGNITQKTQIQPIATSTRTWTVHYSYNPAGQLMSMTYPSGARVDYGYSQGKLVSIKFDDQLLLNNITYEPFGPVNGWTWGNGEIHQRIYDKNGRLIQHTLPNLPTAWHGYGYDDLHRLIRAETIGGGSSGIVLRYIYDPTGNRKQQIVNGEETVYQMGNASNQVLKIEGGNNLVSFQYDANGSTTQQIGTLGNTQSTGLTYDARGRLAQANGTLYKINALELRIEKLGNGTDTPSGARQFVYDELGHLIGEYDPVSGAAQIEHIWLGDMPVAAIKDTQTYYVYADHLNTPRAITNTSNQTVWYWDYTQPFGETKPNDNPSNLGALTYNLRFPGQYYDNETGLHYNWYRTYHSQTGRYIESDPIGLGGGINTYVYVSGNPIMNIDPEGLEKRIPKPTVEQMRLIDNCMCSEGKGFYDCCTEALKARPGPTSMGICETMLLDEPLYNMPYCKPPKNPEPPKNPDPSPKVMSEKREVPRCF